MPAQRSCQFNQTKDSTFRPLAPASDIAEDVSSKKVGFEPVETNTIIVPEASTPNEAAENTLKPLQRSRDRHLRLRPILKSRTSLESTNAPAYEDDVVSTEADFAALLTRLDDKSPTDAVAAYVALQRLLISYKQKPEAELLGMRLHGLEHQLKRHITHLDPGVNDDVDSLQRAGLVNITQCAWTMLILVVHHPIYKKATTDNFQQWAFERALRMIKAPKTTRNNLVLVLHFLGSQDCRQIINVHSNRPLQILQHLHGLAQRRMSNAVTRELLSVYKRLSMQVPEIMEQRAGLWLGPLFLAMTSFDANVRETAQKIAQSILYTTGNTKSIARAARFYLEVGNDCLGMIRVLKYRTLELLKSKDEHASKTDISMIWALVLVFAGGRAVKLEKWSMFREWIQIWEDSFNTTDAELKVECLRAWNYLHIIAKPYDAVDKVREMYVKPLLAELYRPATESSAKNLRSSSTSSYCMLLYYAFRPARTVLQYHDMWDEYIMKVMRRSFISASGANADLCCRILSALFRPSSAVQSWNERRAYESQMMMPSELPTIDCKWLRDNMAQVLTTVRVLIQCSSFGPRNAVSDKALVCETWRRLLQALQESSRKEVIQSVESKSALQNVISLLVEEPIEQSPTNSKHIAYGRKAMLARIAVEELGVAVVAQAFEAADYKITCPLFVEILDELFRTMSTTSGLSEAEQVRISRYLDSFYKIICTFDSSPPQSYEALRHIGRCLNTIPAVRVPELIKTWKGPLGDLYTQVSRLEPPQPGDGNQSKASIFVMATLRIVKLLLNTTLVDLDELMMSMCSSRLFSDPPVRSSLYQILHEVEPSRRGPKISHILAEADAEEASTLLPQAKVDNAASEVSATAKRPRHDDSQVQFISIASSSPLGETVESQLLTTRQKEVRSRQKEDRSITFADLGSTPSKLSTSDNSTPAQTLFIRPETLPGTPILPDGVQAQHDDDHPATPTPKARKFAMDSVLQPDLGSSPSYTIDGEQKITDPSRAIPEINALPAATSAGPVIPELVDSIRAAGDGVIAQAVTEVNELKDVIEDSMTFEERDEDIDQEESPPMFYSDEDDALAASQLSQSLVQESQSFEEALRNTAQVDVSGTPKRKRISSEADCPTASKRARKDERASPQSQDLVIPCTANEADSEVEDCIVVNVRDSQVSQSSKTRKRRPSKKTSNKPRRERSKTPSQASSQSSSSPVSSQKPRMLRRGRSSKSPRPIANEDDVIVIEDESETKKLDEVQDNLHNVWNGNDTIPAVQVGIGPDHTAIESHPSTLSTILEGAEEFSPPVPPPSAEEELGFDVIDSLQGILERLSRSGQPQVVDLAKVHNLCFQIGLKAQELAK